MERILTYHITEESNQQLISSFLKAQGYSSQNLVELKKMPESVLINNTWTYMNQRLHTGDVLTIHIREEASSEKIPPVELPLDIIYEDEDLLIVNKPAGMPIHPSMNNYDNSLGNALAYYFAKQNKPFVFRCINRLDRDTSGLTIVAKHMVSAGMLSSMVARKGDNQSSETVSYGITREYLAIVRGSIHPSKGTITAPIARKPGSILERQVDFAQGEHAVTHYRTIDEQNGHSLVSLILETGRTHQIRVHMKYLGYPLIGDYLYNPDMEYINRQALHSYRLHFIHPITRKVMDFTAPLPCDMRNVACAQSPWSLPQSE
ncbi:MAG: RluA family pseudouridine synthase [Lachnospiraceae bacterium]|nr:RluA family pseudouridine synthase [Lachnospiraceae bacterium]